MSDRPRILHLDDDPVVRDLVPAALRAAGLDVDLVGVASLEEFGRALEAGPWDAILSDFEVPDSKGIEALDLARAKDPEVPFVYVTGSIGEEAAVECLRRGAADCVFKDRLARLGEVVRRAVGEARERRARRRAEAEACDAGALARQVIASASVGIIVLDRSLRYMAWNPVMEEMSGYKARDVMGKTPMDLFPFIREQGLDALLRRALDGETIEVPDMLIEAPASGRSAWNSTRMGPLRDGRGDVVGVILMLLDVSGRKKAERALRESEERFREFAENVRDVMWIAEPDLSRIIYVSPSYERVWGRSREELYAAPRSWAEAIHPEDRERVIGAALDHSTSGAYDQVYRILRPDGTVRWIHDRGFGIRSAGGEVLRVAGLAEDVTALKETEEALRESERRLAEALRRSEDRVVQLEEQVRARGGLERLVGKGAAMQEVYRKIRLAAQSDVTVLVTGESGTGKELAAGAIHALSARKGKPFVAVNCAAIPEALLESELFGHVKGAFTGAVRDKVGLFEAAQGGTLVLDEVGEMPPAIQAKVLRALQEREIRRVGDERTLKVDVRLVAATNQDLKALLASGALREDFYYRIRVFEIAMPPLRRRRDDIPLLASRFVSEFSASTGKKAKGIAAEALRRLMEYPWPGNVRELRNAIEHAFVALEGDHLSLSDFPPEVRAPQGAESAVAKGLSAAEEEDRRRLLEAIEKAGGDRGRAAKALGISRVTLWKRMRRWGLRPGEAGRKST